MGGRRRGVEPQQRERTGRPVAAKRSNRPALGRLPVTSNRRNGGGPADGAGGVRTVLFDPVLQEWIQPHAESSETSIQQLKHCKVEMPTASQLYPINS